MKRGSIKKTMLKFSRVLSSIVLIVTFLSVGNPVTVKAQINEETEDKIDSQTAYLDMSSVSPLQLHFTEDNQEKKPDYYYAAQAFNILKERTEIDPMYRNCNEVIVTIHRANVIDDVMFTNSEPQVQTGYLNLLSKETNKYYTIDRVIIHIQRDK